VSSAAAVSFELHANKPRIDVRVNGSGPYDFLVDSGSIVDLVDKRRAAELKLTAMGQEESEAPGNPSWSSGPRRE
jgi:Aspartyl protease